MKLYTEEQMLSFANWCRIHDSYNRNEVWTIGQLLTKFENSEPLSKPIPLPNDYDIEEMSGGDVSFEFGAKWLRNKIQGE